MVSHTQEVARQHFHQEYMKYAERFHTKNKSVVHQVVPHHIPQQHAKQYIPDGTSIWKGFGKEQGFAYANMVVRF